MAIDNSKETELVGSIDAGTTSVRFIIFNQYAQIEAWHGKEFAQFYEHPGWHAQEPDEIVDCVMECIEQAVRKLEKKKRYTRKDIKVIGVTNQRETTVVWNKTTGKALTRAIAWPDVRTAGVVKQLARKSELGVRALKKQTGLPLSTYFAAVKLRWMLEHLPEVKEAHDAKNMLFGTVDSWLVYNLTNGKRHITDASNASRTMFMDVRKQTWCPQLCDFFGIDIDILPEIRSSSEVYGVVEKGALKGIEIAGIVGDQMAALVGQKALEPGQAKNTYGTGAFLLYNTGDHVVDSKNGLLSTIAYQAGPNAKPVYALEGSIAVAGSCIKWMRDSMQMIGDSMDIGWEASKVPDTAGVYFVTAFNGLLSPYWDSSARGTIVGITRFTTKQHMCRAALEAVCYQTEAVLKAMEEESGFTIAELRVDGGMVDCDEAMQIQADILGITVARPEMRETTALGSALLAGAAKGMFGWDLNDPKTLVKVNAENGDTFESRIDKIKRAKMIRGWNRAVERAKGWDEEEEEDTDTEQGKEDHE